MCGLIRCIFGNPFRPPPAVEPAWLDWGGGVVARMALDIYDGHAFDHLPVLADALLDAGYPPDHELLLHLRGPGVHVRGCAAVDCLLGRQ